jgi:hypothetical protein
LREIYNKLIFLAILAYTKYKKASIDQKATSQNKQRANKKFIIASKNQ